MPDNKPPKKTPEEMRKIRQDFIAKVNESKRLKKMQTTNNSSENSGTPSEETNTSKDKTQDIIPETPVENASSITNDEIQKALNQKDEAMKVAEISEISVFKKPPIIHEHAGNIHQDKPSPNSATSSGETFDEGDGLTEKVHQNGNAAQPAQPIPPTNGQPPVDEKKVTEENEEFLKQHGFEDGSGTHNTDQQQQTPGDAVHPNRKQAEQTFEFSIAASNKFITDATPLLVRPKEKKFSDQFEILPIESKKVIRGQLDVYTSKCIDDMIINKEEIEMIREPAIQVIMESGMAMSAKQQLRYGISMIAARMLKNGFMLAQNKKNVIAEVNAEIMQAVNGMSAEMNRRFDVFEQKTNERIKEMQEAESEKWKKHYEKLSNKEAA